jgi:hypothetical protein
VSHDHRLTARARARELVEVLKAEATAAELAASIEEAAHLERAIDAYHMEAIRFRMYTLLRRMQREPHLFGDRARAVMGELKSSLDAAGFQTE